MNFRAYLLASSILPLMTLIYIVIGLSIDTYTDHFNLAKEIADGGLQFLLMSYIFLVLVNFIITFLIIFFIPVILKSLGYYNRTRFFILGAFVGAIATIITFSLMADGNIVRENGLYSLWFGIFGMLFGLITVYIYSKFAYAMDFCD